MCHLIIGPRNRTCILWENTRQLSVVSSTHKPALGVRGRKTQRFKVILGFQNEFQVSLQDLRLSSQGWSLGS